MVLETRAQVAASDFTAPPVDLVGPAVSIAGVGVVRHELGQPAGRRNTLYQVVNNLSHQSGSHALRLGVDFIYNDDRITYPRAFRGSYSFRRWRIFWPASTTTPVHADVRRIRHIADQSQSRTARAGRVEARARGLR